MGEHKKPGSHSEKLLEHNLKIRVDNETLDKVEFCMKELKMARSEALQKGTDTLYDQPQRK